MHAQSDIMNSHNNFNTFANSVNLTNGLVSNNPGACLFDAAASRDYHIMVQLYASNARNSIANFLSMKNRWKQQQRQHEHYQKGAYATSGKTAVRYLDHLKKNSTTSDAVDSNIAWHQTCLQSFYAASSHSPLPILLSQSFVLVNSVNNPSSSSLSDTRGKIG